ncbi:hypothetical protein [Paenibacillus xylanilyticus]|uniref:Lipoprotein n=1 Tax=Paenibacillus xylanilyticus TaxID=248903 RepID=A0A7Y6EVB3_9BACL|nr:hypothetical protein [Paenibacillus xylanilyticus]NUU78022.1 hypothetical protein [Paenibacillus xylanilyticus]
MRIQIKLSVLFLAVIILSSCQSSSQTNSNNNNSSGDWPSYNFEELVSTSDLIVYGEITDTKNKNSTPPSQESNLKVLKSLKGDESDHSLLINLSDPDYYVKSGSKYVMFLDNIGSYYTQKSANSLLIELDGKFPSSIKGLNGNYSLEEIALEISKITSDQ